jgi:predicted ATPase/class 3 adenylate cyclase
MTQSSAATEITNSATVQAALLFTDIEGSTRLCRILGHRYAALLEDHRAILRTAVAAHGGREIDSQGDGCFFAFPDPLDAVVAAGDAQQSLVAHSWPAGEAVRVRMGIHFGKLAPATKGYTGIDIHRASRIAALGHGGQILLSQTAAQAISDRLPAGFTLLDLGYHRLKDLIEPDHLHQLSPPSLPSDFPAIRSLSADSNNLPAASTSFVGRERELADVLQLLSATRLLTLTGSGGIGKTRLALAAAEALLDGYPDGVWLVELASINDSNLIAAAVAKALGVPERAGIAVLPALADALETRRLLLILDNCEHLIGSCASLADELLRTCPNLQVLATSREPLRAAGESILPVPSLGTTDESTVTCGTDPLESDAVRLFADRAAAVLLGFTVNQENASTVRKICRDLDGMPLAIELAAARARVLSIEQLSVGLSDRFRLLTTGWRTSPPRQQTLRAAIDWSYALLSSEEQALLARLSVFAGGFNYEAASAVCGAAYGELGFQLLDPLSGLVDKSLVVFDARSETKRYRMLETIRQYAAEKLDECGDMSVVRSRHRDYYTGLAKTAWPELVRSNQAEWLNQLESDHDNFRAALRWSLETNDGIAGLELATALGRFWERRGYMSEGRNWIARAMKSAKEIPTELHARGLEYAGRLARLQGDFGRAQPMLEEALRLYRELGDRWGTATTLTYVGIVALRQGDIVGARPFQEEALELYRGLGDVRGVGVALLQLGNIARREGDLLQALALREEALAHYRAAGDQQGVAIALDNLGIVAADMGDFAKAIALRNECIALGQELGDWYVISRALYGLARAYLGSGDCARSAELNARALCMCRDHGDDDGIAYCLEGIAAVAAKNGDAFAAARSLGTATALRERIHAPLSAEGDRRVPQTAGWAAAAALGSKDFDEAMAGGAGMDLRLAIEEALAYSSEFGREMAKG